MGQRPISQGLLNQLSQPAIRPGEYVNSLRQGQRDNQQGKLNQLAIQGGQQQQQARQRSSDVEMAQVANSVAKQIRQIPDINQRLGALNQAAQRFPWMFEGGVSESDATDESLDQQIAATNVGRAGVNNQPSTVQEWNYFNSLPKEDQARYLNMKRSSTDIKEIGGVQSLVDKNNQTVTPLNSLQSEQQAQATLAGSKAQASEQAKAQVQLKMGPMIKVAIKKAEIEAKAKGETLTELNKAKAALPGLQSVVEKLVTLSDVATYTTGGKAFDVVVKELGFGSTKGGTARAKMQSLVDNQVLPLLRDTFGAAFTKAEGDSLRATMLDVDAGPEQKKATLNAFIEQKIRDIETKEREVGLKPIEPATDQALPGGWSVQEVQ